MKKLSLIALLAGGLCGGSPVRATSPASRPIYPYKKDIVTTCFWVGEGTCGYNSTDNTKSAWDPNWVQNFGGIDSPESRVAVQPKPGAASLPARFVPRQNPFYIALPFNDLKFPEVARKVVPWWRESSYRENPKTSQCKGRWIQIYYQGRICYAQWEDVGPFRVDHHEYVFGPERPTIHSQAGLDVSPAVRDYLGLGGLNKTTWRFVNASEVPRGPWTDIRVVGATAPRPRALPRIRLSLIGGGSLLP